MIGSEASRQIRAVLRIQWLSLRNSLRWRSERVGLLLSALVAFLWYGIWTAGAVGLFAAGMLSTPQRLARLLPGLLLLIFLYWQLSPLLTASMGVSIDVRKMAFYPIGVDTLFLVECLLRLINGLEMVLLLTGLSAGLVLRAAARPWAIAAAVLLFIGCNVLVSAGLRQLIERFLRRRGLRELFVLLIVIASVTPQLLVWTGAAEEAGRRLARAFQFLPHSVLPSTSLARIYLGQDRASEWAVLGAWLAGAGAFGLRQFRRAFRSDPAPAPRVLPPQPAAGRWTDRLYHLPSRLLPDPMGALVGKELRYLLRSPRFRFLFLMGCSFGVIVWLPFAVRRGGVEAAPFQSSFLALVSLYALLLIGQIVFLNAFGLDRSAARYFFWMPVSPSLLIAAKNLVGGLFVVLQVAVLALICALLRVATSPWQVLEALAVAGVASFYMASVGNLTSILFASGMSPERVSRAGAGRGIQGLVVLFYPILLSPLFAAYFARYYWNTLRGFTLLLAIAGFGAVALYAATLPLAARLAWTRRERLIEDLTRGEGPLVSD